MSAAVQTVLDDQRPWPGLDAFQEDAERFFNGRATETSALRRLVLNAPLAILFSASGLGKTSLIQAGLFPVLRKENFLPIKVRLDCRDRSAPLITQVRSAFQDQITALRVDAPPFKEGESLWHYLHRSDLELWSPQNRLLTPVFVLDQFEEVFTLGADNAAAVNRLMIDLTELVDNRIPAAVAKAMEAEEEEIAALSVDSQRYRVLLSFREDFLPAFEGWKKQMPSILRNRLRLLPMSGEDGFRAVYDSAPHLVDKALAWRIVRFVAAAQEERPGEPTVASDPMHQLSVEPALLSLVCDGLNDKRKERGKQAFDDALLSGTGQSIIADFYDRKVGDLSDRVQRFIESELITERGFRKPCDLDDARTVHGVTDEELRLLENRRVLRIEPQHGTNRVELIHDLLTGVVRQHRDKRREQVKAQERRKEQRQKFKALLTATVIAFLAVLSASAMLSWSFSQKARRAEAKENDRIRRDVDRYHKLDAAAAVRRAAYAQLRTGKDEAALQGLRSALGTYQEVNDYDSAAATLIEIGDVLASTGRFAEAESTYTQARQLVTEKNQQALEGKVLESLASVKDRQNKLSEAFQLYQAANQAYQKSGDYQASGRVLERLAFENESSHDLPRAASLYEEALKSYEVSGDELGRRRARQALDRILGYWGFLVDLIDGKLFPLRPDKVTVGRNVEDVQNDISFTDRLISRRHLALSRDLHVDDLRSRNGTTLNASLLPYGVGAKLSDQDILVLAGIRPLQFLLKKPTHPLSVPSDSWGVLIDDQSKTYHYLNRDESCLIIGGGRISLAPGSTGCAVRLRRGQGKPQMWIGHSDWEAMTTLKETDYEYKSYILSDSQWIDLYEVPISFVKLSADKKSISVDGPKFQVVLFQQPSS